MYDWWIQSADVYIPSVCSAILHLHLAVCIPYVTALDRGTHFFGRVTSSAMPNVTAVHVGTWPFIIGQLPRPKPRGSRKYLCCASLLGSVTCNTMHFELLIVISD